jgi:hypothetical protein
LIFTLNLEGRGGAECRVEGNVGVIAVGGARLDIPPALTICLGARAASGAVPGEFIQRCLEFARGELRTGFGLFTTFPPVGILVVKDVLWGGVSLTVVR